MASSGVAVVVWELTGGIFGLRFLPESSSPPGSTVLLDVDANGAVDALTDGMLILRRLIGFSGAALITGTVANDCWHCGAGAIAAYIDSIVTRLDVDRSDEVEPLTDGLMILRRLFEFAGTRLTDGALANDCRRCDPQDIATYIDGLSR
jgi:hypothetical protein